MSTSTLFTRSGSNEQQTLRTVSLSEQLMRTRNIGLILFIITVHVAPFLVVDPWTDVAEPYFTLSSPFEQHLQPRGLILEHRRHANAFFLLNPKARVFERAPRYRNGRDHSGQHDHVVPYSTEELTQALLNLYVDKYCPSNTKVSITFQNDYPYDDKDDIGADGSFDVDIEVDADIKADADHEVCGPSAWKVRMNVYKDGGGVVSKLLRKEAREEEKQQEDQRVGLVVFVANFLDNKGKQTPQLHNPPHVPYIVRQRVKDLLLRYNEKIHKNWPKSVDIIFRNDYPIKVNYPIDEKEEEKHTMSDFDFEFNDFGKKRRASDWTVKSYERCTVPPAIRVALKFQISDMAESSAVAYTNDSPSVEEYLGLLLIEGIEVVETANEQSTECQWLVRQDKIGSNCNGLGSWKNDNCTADKAEVITIFGVSKTIRLFDRERCFAGQNFGISSFETSFLTKPNTTSSCGYSQLACFPKYFPSRSSSARLRDPSSFDLVEMR
ncbi:hypothetical protein F5878DRAFT_709508, partial [Lentinula raphanica]